MKKILLIFAIFFSMVEFVFAQESGFGIGIMLGEPSGIAGKYFLDKTTAIDFGVGTGFLGSGSGFAFQADYVQEIKNLIKWKYKLPFYYGFGIRTRFPSENSMYFGVRGVAGLMMYVKKLPVDVFFEIAPSFRLLPTTGLDLDMAVGGRYYFKIKPLF
jgi:hypothetical protein